MKSLIAFVVLTAIPFAAHASYSATLPSAGPAGAFPNRSLPQGEVSAAQLIQQRGSLSDTLNGWRNEAQQRRRDFMETYHPAYRTIPEQDWVDLKTRAFEAIMERRLAGEVRSDVQRALRREHRSAEGRLYTPSLRYGRLLAAMEEASSPLVARAEAKRMFTRLYYNTPVDQRRTLVLWRVLDRADPVLADDPESQTVLTAKDVAGFVQFEQATGANWPGTPSPDDLRAGAVRLVRAHQSAAATPCTWGVRRIAMLGPMASFAKQRWSQLSPAQRNRLRSFALGTSSSWQGLGRVSGLAEAKDVYGMAGVDAMDLAERRTIESAENAAAMMDPATALGVINPAIQAAWARQLAKCGG